MARPPRAIRPVEKKVSLPEDIVGRIDLELFSDFEGKVPHGAWSRLLGELLHSHLVRAERVRRLAIQLSIVGKNCELDRSESRQAAINLLLDELETLGYGAVLPALKKALL